MSSRLNLIPISPLVVPRDPRRAAQHRLTGYWFLDGPEGWALPAGLRGFLEAGEPLVAVTLGAMSLGGGADALDTAQVVFGAIREAGVRAIVIRWEV